MGPILKKVKRITQIHDSDSPVSIMTSTLHTCFSGLNLQYFQSTSFQREKNINVSMDEKKICVLRIPNIQGIFASSPPIPSPNIDLSTSNILFYDNINEALQKARHRDIILLGPGKYTLSSLTKKKKNLIDKSIWI